MLSAPLGSALFGAFSEEIRETDRHVVMFSNQIQTSFANKCKYMVARVFGHISKVLTAISGEIHWGK